VQSRIANHWDARFSEKVHYKRDEKILIENFIGENILIIWLEEIMAL
jgi:hypothetical protein